MDRKSNFRRGSVELMVLHLLSLRDYYGYELTQIIRQETNGVIDIPIGSLYPAQNRTEIYHQLTGFPFGFFTFILLPPENILLSHSRLQFHQRKHPFPHLGHVPFLLQGKVPYRLLSSACHRNLR